ncbi:MAG: metallophosphoesterase [Pseudomonadales bacterium]
MNTGAPAGAARVSVGRRLYRRLAPFVVFLVLYYAVLVYPPLRMLTLALPDFQPGSGVLVALLAGPAIGRLIYEWLPGRPARALAALVMTWLGVCFMAFCLLLPWELLSALLPLPSQASGVALLGATAALTGFAFVSAERLHLRHVDVPATEAARGLTLVQLSDVHVGSRSGRFLARAVRLANRADGDCVLITGDLVDFRHIGADVLAPLAELDAPSYFIIGNHERYVDCAEICARLEALGVTVLRNRSVTSGPLQLIGIDDAEPKSQVSRVLPSISPATDAFRVLLYHRPDGAPDAARWGCHLMLCGHTHNGQIVPFNYLVRRIFPLIHGLYEVDGMRLYVSPGTGTWGPVLRLGSRCEVTAIRLV